MGSNSWDTQSPVGDLSDLSRADLVDLLGAACAALAARSARDDDMEFALRARASCSRVTERLSALNLDWLGIIDAQNGWAGDGSRSAAAWLARQDHITYRDARRQVNTARTLRSVLPATADAARAGTIPLTNAYLIANTANTSARVAALHATSEGADSTLPAPEPLADPTSDTDQAATTSVADPPSTCEEQLIAMASLFEPQVMRRITEHFALVADPDQADRAYRERTRREYLEISHTLDGYHLTGFLTHANGQLIKATLTAINNTLIATTPSSTADSGGLADSSSSESSPVAVSNANNGRQTASVLGAEEPDPLGTKPLFTAGQRNAIALTAMAHLAAGRPILENKTPTPAAVGTDMPSGQDTSSSADRRVQTHLTVTVSYTELCHVMRGYEDLMAAESTGKVSRHGASPPIADQRAQTLFDHNGPPLPGSAGGQSRPLPQDLHTLISRPPAHWADGTGPIPHSVLRWIATTGTINRVIFGPDSQILNLGRSARVLTGNRRRAIIARDRTCVWPTCDAPPQLCEVHHATVHWADGGHTSTLTGALLCYWHHNHCDRNNIAMRRINGAWHFGPPGSYSPTAQWQPIE
ncbi:DUF222 domain-containing protein [Rarobacter incanus]|uniref:Uncharacterized protein DUF222 n=1 Tax=Rarobacter incanus TaxID=153494 RepID=A0A542SQD6_9MICO|nr:DUF222 domain-containing protein [Rarobacter incanus]TQK76798.1 uncharacterized protein DUF222 [Rarobacter incanus]